MSKIIDILLGQGQSSVLDQDQETTNAKANQKIIRNLIIKIISDNEDHKECLNHGV